MYEDIRKPELLKNIPMPFVRALPVIYYFAKYVTSIIPDQVDSIFQSHFKYLINSVKLLGENIDNVEFVKLSEKLTAIDLDKSQDLLNEIEQRTVELSNLCTMHKNQVESAIRKIRPGMQKYYLENTNRLKILLVEMNGSVKKVDKLDSVLRNFCFYDVERTRPNMNNYLKALIDTNFVLFSSTHSSSIHQQVKSLTTYKKPGLALTQIEKEEIPDRQAIRHGAQLIKTGFQVLFKIFTPVRLFTSIDKIYMKYHLAK